MPPVWVQDGDEDAMYGLVLRDRELIVALVPSLHDLLSGDGGGRAKPIGENLSSFLFHFVCVGTE
jgi:hypothetical protein